MSGYIAVDLDATLAKYDGWVSEEHIGEPVPKMLDRVIKWLSEGVDVRIMTARVSPQPGGGEAHARLVIQKWCMRHLGKIIPVTCIKDYQMVERWDDRAVQVIPNTGERADGK